MSQSMPWFRTYEEIIHDIKIKRIARALGCYRALVIGVWVSLLAYGNESPERGVLRLSDSLVITIEDIFDITDVPVELLDSMLNEFRDKEMLDGISPMVIRNWKKRQFNSDSSTERVRKLRDKKADIPEPEDIPEEIPVKKTRPKKEETMPLAVGDVPEWIPEKLRNLCRVFSLAANVTVPENKVANWLDALFQLEKMGATEEMIKQAVARLRKNNMVCVRPGAVIAGVTNIQATKEDTVTRYDADGNPVED